ncbi:hypothetical protein [Empedobacter sp. GD03739]|uniref:hypothetical protein n=1 Tax=Empedobacter sp. GD03739 TaxID=2975376 RepID=UPI00244B1435|nr:hypothetical protein [Empedobacter sp. GD03739]MDH1602345.1 hypothetical protein [Empedobacter sp. GD03739]
MSKIIKISNLKQDNKNFNKHTDAGMELLGNSIDKVGVIESFTVSLDDKIITGNARQEKMLEKFGDVEPILIETDGQRPIVIKRTDIKSDTKEFYEAALLANTVSKNNINFDDSMIEEVAVAEFDIDVEELGYQNYEEEDEEELEHKKTVEDLSNMIAVALTDDEQEVWNKIKENLNKKKDKNAIFELIKFYSNEKGID